MNMDYFSPLIHYKDSSDTRYFYFLNYIDGSSVFDATLESYCPAVKAKDIYFRNCWDNVGLHNGYKDFVSTGLRTNFGLWIFIGIMLIFFIWTNGAERVTKPDPKHENNHWLLHPLYSVLQFGSEEFTKTARMA